MGAFMSVPLTKYTAVLFDKDGTVVDLAGPWLSEMAELIRGLDPLNFEKLATLVGLEVAPLRVVPFSVLAQGSFADLAGVLAEHVRGSSAQDILDILMQRANGSFRHVTPLPGSFEAIKALHERGYLMGIISNDSAEGIEFMMQALNVAPYIDYIAGSDSGFGPKPNTGMVADFCAEHNLDPRQVVLVGDGLSDMQTAEMSGCGLSVAIHADPQNPTLQYYTGHILPELTMLPTLLGQFEYAL